MAVLAGRGVTGAPREGHEPNAYQGKSQLVSSSDKFLLKSTREIKTCFSSSDKFLLKPIRENHKYFSATGSRQG